MCLQSWWACLLELPAPGQTASLCRGGCLVLQLTSQVECTLLLCSWGEVRGPSMVSDFYLPKDPSAHILAPPLTVLIFFYSLAMRNSSWPGPRGRVRKRSRSGWRDSGVRSKRTWSWPSPSARLTCRLRRCREATAVYTYTHAQHAPRFKPCYATATTAKDKLAAEPWALGPCSEAVDAAYPCGWARRAADKRPGS